MFGPSSQVILSASRPLSAAQVFLAMTATPPSGANFAGAGVPSSFTTFSTPGTFMAALASSDATLPPTTGGRAIDGELHARQHDVLAVDRLAGGDVEEVDDRTLPLPM